MCNAERTLPGDSSPRLTARKGELPSSSPRPARGHIPCSHPIPPRGVSGPLADVALVGWGFSVTSSLTLSALGGELCAFPSRSDQRGQPSPRILARSRRNGVS